MHRVPEVLVDQPEHATLGGVEPGEHLFFEQVARESQTIQGVLRGVPRHLRGISRLDSDTLLLRRHLDAIRADGGFGGRASRVSWYCEKAPSKRPQTHKIETELRAAERPRPPSSLFPRPPSPRLTPPGTFSDPRPPTQPHFHANHGAYTRRRPRDRASHGARIAVPTPPDREAAGNSSRSSAPGVSRRWPEPGVPPSRVHPRRHRYAPSVRFI